MANETQTAPPLDDIEAVVEYALHGELEDYLHAIDAGDIEPGDEAHIYVRLRRVSAWLDSVR